MRRRTWAVVAAVPVAAVAAGGVLAASGGGGADARAEGEPAASTAAVQRGSLNAAVTLTGILTRRARPDAINNARGTYTWLPATGAAVRCGDVLYRVDDRPVLLLCGAVPAYRALKLGARGGDVRALNRALRVHDGAAFTPKTQRALKAWQRGNHMDMTGKLALGGAVVLPGPVRIATVVGVLGGAAQPGAPVLRTTADALGVQADLDASQQGVVQRGDRVRITLPDNTVARGRVERLGAVVQSAKGATATIPASIALDHPKQARGLDQAPVQVDVTTRGVQDVLNVPVTALVGRAGGGFGVEVVGAGGARMAVAVKLGLFDTSAGRVQVDGALHEGDRVVVPAP